MAHALQNPFDQCAFAFVFAFIEPNHPAVHEQSSAVTGRPRRVIAIFIAPITDFYSFLSISQIFPPQDTVERGEWLRSAGNCDIGRVLLCLFLFFFVFRVLRA
jgi:hypothetical protein